MGVTERTLNYWKVANPNFFHALKTAKDLSDELVEASLFHRAMGYEHKDIKIFCSEGRIVSEEYIKHVPPDVTAAIFWLKNRRPEKWRDKPRNKEEQIIFEVPHE